MGLGGPWLEINGVGWTLVGNKWGWVDLGWK